MISVRLNNALRNNQKAGKAIAELGCSIADFRKYIEAQFEPGMTWENRGRGGWTLQRIQSEDECDSYEEFAHYTNLQPKWVRNAYNLQQDLAEGIVAQAEAAVTGDGYVEALHCTCDQFRDHLKSMFRRNMAIENFGVYWRLEFIKPLKSFDLTSKFQHQKAAHYMNIRPVYVHVYCSMPSAGVYHT